MSRGIRLLILAVLVAAPIAWWATRRQGDEAERGRTDERSGQRSPTETGRRAQRTPTAPSLPDVGPARPDEAPVAEDRFLGAEAATPPVSPNPPPEPPRASVDPEEPELDDPRDFDPPAEPGR